jgi:hypothetical protein
LDPKDPLLPRNLSRLEKRFKERYYSSVQKDIKRRQKGKPSHATTLKSIRDNKLRLDQVRELRRSLINDSRLKVIRNEAIHSFAEGWKC